MTISGNESVTNPLPTVIAPFDLVSLPIGEGLETGEIEEAILSFVNTVNTGETTVNTVNTKLTSVTSEGSVIVHTAEGDKPTKEFFKWMQTTYNRKPQPNKKLIDARRDELYTYIESNPTREALDWVISHDEIVGDDCYNAAIIRLRVHAEHLEMLENQQPQGGRVSVNWTVNRNETFLNKSA